MSTVTIVLLVIALILLAAVVVLYFLGKRAQKKQEEQQAQIAAASQSVSMLIIDKKKMKLKDAGLPAAVLAQTPKLMRGSKVPIVKAKVGPKVMTMLCDANVFEIIPVKKKSKPLSADFTSQVSKDFMVPLPRQHRSRKVSVQNCSRNIMKQAHS